MRPAAAEYLLGELTPNLFSDDPLLEYEAKPDEVPEMLDIFCFALNLNKNSQWPIKDWPQTLFWDGFVEICKHRYAQHGHRLNSVPTLVGFTGYFKVKDGHILSGVFRDTKIPIPLYEKGKDIIIEDGFSHSATLKIPSKRISMEILPGFLEQGCNIDSEGGAWAWPGETPEHDDAVTSCSSAGPSASVLAASSPPPAAKSSSSPNELLCAVLRSKLQGTGAAVATAPCVT